MEAPGNASAAGRNAREAVRNAWESPGNAREAYRNAKEADYSHNCFLLYKSPGHLKPNRFENLLGLAF
ncbi:MAG: hypothetical protein Q8909_03075 [Bacteroidota bacterium]|nr:hypothetical protein [Bacteroidota bacterium]